MRVCYSALRSKPRRGGLFIEGRAPADPFFLFFSGAVRPSYGRAGVTSTLSSDPSDCSSAVPLKNKKIFGGMVPFYKQPTPTGFWNGAPGSGTAFRFALPRGL